MMRRLSMSDETSNLDALRAAAARGEQAAKALTSQLPNSSTYVMDHSATEKPCGQYETAFRVGKFLVQMAFTSGTPRMMARWLPRFPNRELYRAEMRQYRAGRDAFQAQIAAGLNVSR